MGVRGAVCAGWCLYMRVRKVRCARVGIAKRKHNPKCDSRAPELLFPPPAGSPTNSALVDSVLAVDSIRRKGEEPVVPTLSCARSSLIS